jgi:hypothetical protein
MYGTRKAVRTAAYLILDKIPPGLADDVQVTCSPYSGVDLHLTTSRMSLAERVAWIDAVAALIGVKPDWHVRGSHSYPWEYGAEGRVRRVPVKVYTLVTDQELSNQPPNGNGRAA